MVRKNRVPLQVDADFRNDIKKIQEEIMKQRGEFKGAKIITHDITKIPEWNLVKARLIKKDDLDVKVNFDRRRR